MYGAGLSTGCKASVFQPSSSTADVQRSCQRSCAEPCACWRRTFPCCGVCSSKTLVVQGDALVIPCNPSMQPSGAANGAVHHAAGPELSKLCALYPSQSGIYDSQTIVRCPMGHAQVTAAGARLEVRYVVHACGPVYDGGSKVEDLLRLAYLCDAPPAHLRSFAVRSGRQNVQRLVHKVGLVGSLVNKRTVTVTAVFECVTSPASVHCHASSTSLHVAHTASSTWSSTALMQERLQSCKHATVQHQAPGHTCLRLWEQRLPH